MAGTCSSVVAPAGTDQLDLEAAEQLIQLSGGDGDAGSETKSADSVKCCRGKEDKEKEAAAVDSRRRRRRRSAGTVLLAPGKDGDGGGESGSCSKAADTSPCTATAAGAVGKEEEDEVVVDLVVEGSRRRRSGERFPAGKGYCGGGGGIVHGEARRRPRFRPLADIYRQTTETRRMAGGGEGHADRARDAAPLGDKDKEKKRAADEAVTFDDAGASKARRLAQSAHARM